MKLRLHSALFCLLLAAVAGKSQVPASTQTPNPNPPPTPDAPLSTANPTVQQPSATLRPPPEVPSTVNTGQGFSIDATYWFGKSHPVLRGGQADLNTEPGNFDYDNNPKAALEGRVSIPIGTNSVLRGSYFQAQSLGSAVGPANLILFGQSIDVGDTLATRYRLEGFKLSYEYLTYFWKRPTSEIRLKTLYELQRISVTNEVDDFVPNNINTAFTLNSATGSPAVFLPTLGLGLEYTVSPHFRMEARGSGFGLPHRGAIGDGEATMAYRQGHVEVFGGYRFLHFKTSPKSDQYNVGSLYGPYVGLRLYWKKQ